MTAPADGTALYRIYGEGAVLLYIGITKDFGARWRQHARLQPWWGEMRRLTVDAWYETRQEAGEAEEAAIKAEKPKYNKNLAKPESPPKPKSAQRKKSPSSPQHSRSVIYVDRPPGESAAGFFCQDAGIRCLRVDPPDYLGCQGEDGPGYPCLLDICTPERLRNMGVIVRPSRRHPEPAV